MHTVGFSKIEDTPMFPLSQATPPAVNFEVLATTLSTSKSNIKILKRIPKGARMAVAEKLTTIIDSCTNKNDEISWRNLFCFATMSLHVPTKSKSISLTTAVKKNVNNNSFPAKSVTKNKMMTLEKRVEAKVADFDTRNAVKILSSNDTLAPVDEANHKKLTDKHPSPSRTLAFPDPPEDFDCLKVGRSEVKFAIFKFPCGSSGGIDGLTPQHLKDLVSNSAGEAGQRLLNSITNLCNVMLAGSVDPTICSLLYGASLCALTKKDGGLRPIAVGNVFRRLVSRLACFSVREQLSDYFQPKQVGFASKGGCEAAIHATRHEVISKSNSNNVLLKIDFRNAFNSIERDAMLNQIKHETPLLYPFLYQCYREPSILLFGDKIISSQVGAQQGDPTGPMSFSLTIHPIIESLLSTFNIWYLDDGTLCDSPDIVLNDFINLMKKAKEIGLEVNADKCELFFCSGKVDFNVLSKFRDVAPGIRVVDDKDLNLLGAPILEKGLQSQIENHLHKLTTMFTRLSSLQAHYAYHLLKNCFAIPKLTYILRTFPLWKFPDIIKFIDHSIRSAMEKIFNIQLDLSQAVQASLPIINGGLGIRRVEDVCLPAFLSSLYSVKDLVSKILHNSDNELQLCYMDEAKKCWESQNGSNYPTVPEFQKNWDLINVQRILEHKFNYEDIYESARLLAIQTKESGCWLQAIPSPNIGTFLDNQKLRVCVALRLGCNICKAHTRNCGVLVDEKGRHGLSCKKSAGRFSRHTELNKILQQSMSSIEIPSTLEPVGLYRDDGKRPDGMTLCPWSKGKCLIWDATCIDTFAASYIESSSKEIGAAAMAASKRKFIKYESLMNNNHFVPFAVETMGPWSTEASQLVNAIGAQLIQRSGDVRSKHYLYQRISLAIQRGNAISIMGTLPSSISMEEIFYL